MRKIKVGIIQQSNTADIKANLMNLAKSIEACVAHGAQLIVLQELHNSLYFCQTENTNLFDLAEPIPGPSTGFYSELAAANKVVLVTSLFEKRAPGLYHNTAVVFDRDGSIAGKYRKMHIPDDPAYYEKFYLRQPCRTRARSFRTDKRYLILGKQFCSRTTRGISGTSRKRSPGEHSSGNRYGTFGKRSSLVAFPS